MLQFSRGLAILFLQRNTPEPPIRNIATEIIRVQNNFFEKVVFLFKFEKYQHLINFRFILHLERINISTDFI